MNAKNNHLRTQKNSWVEETVLRQTCYKINKEYIFLITHKNHLRINKEVKPLPMMSFRSEMYSVTIYR